MSGWVFVYLVFLRGGLDSLSLCNFAWHRIPHADHDGCELREMACLHLPSAQIKDVFDVKGRSLWVCFDAAGPQREYNVGDCFCLGEMYSVDERVLPMKLSQLQTV